MTKPIPRLQMKLHCFWCGKTILRTFGQVIRIQKRYKHGRVYCSPKHKWTAYDKMFRRENLHEKANKAVQRILGKI